MSEPFATKTEADPDNRRTAITDFSRSYCYYAEKSDRRLVRINLNCRCEVINSRAGSNDEYLMSVRTQGGVKETPAEGPAQPGYDRWMIFSRKRVYVRRNHASLYVRDSSELKPESFSKLGWHIESLQAREITQATDFRKALLSDCVIVGEMQFARSDGSLAFRIEFPIKWSDVYFKKDGFRVETGAVLLLNSDRVTVGKPLQFNDFQWAYLDFRRLNVVRCFLQRSTPVFDCTIAPRLRESPPTAEQISQVEQRLYHGWDSPVSEKAMRQLLSTSHYSKVENRQVTTRLFVLDRTEQ